MPLTVRGLIKGDFDSKLSVVRIIETGGAYVDGRWVPGTETRKAYTANVQPVSDHELDFLSSGGERIVDARKLYINENVEDVDLSGEWEFLGSRWKPVKMDNRLSRHYLKITVARKDP